MKKPTFIVIMQHIKPIEGEEECLLFMAKSSVSNTHNKEV